jgi:hypothetical protein
MLEPEPMGWTVTDPDGNIISAGPPIAIELSVSDMLEGQ